MDCVLHDRQVVCDTFIWYLFAIHQLLRPKAGEPTSLRLFRTLAVRPGMSTVEHPLQVFRFADGSLLSAHSIIIIEKNEQFHLIMNDHLSICSHHVPGQSLRV